MRKVASELDIDQSLISKFEKGERKPTKEQLIKLAEFYNLSQQDLRIDWFSITYTGKEYKDFGTAPYVYMSDEGARFFVQILPDDPKRHWLHDIRVPDSITEAPYEGWKELPVQTKNK